MQRTIDRFENFFVEYRVRVNLWLLFEEACIQLNLSMSATLALGTEESGRRVDRFKQESMYGLSTVLFCFSLYFNFTKLQ